MNTIFSSVIVIILAIFANLIFAGNFNDFLKKKKFFSEYNRVKYIRLFMVILYLLTALYLDRFLVKKASDEPLILLAYGTFGMILSVISFNLDKKKASS